LQSSFAYGKVSFGMNRQHDSGTTLTACLLALIADQECLWQSSAINDLTQFGSGTPLG